MHSWQGHHNSTVPITVGPYKYVLQWPRRIKPIIEKTHYACYLLLSF